MAPVTPPRRRAIVALKNRGHSYRAVTVAQNFALKSRVKLVELLVSLSVAKFVRSAPRRLANGVGTLAVVICFAVLAGSVFLFVRVVPKERFVEYRMSELQDTPIAIAAGNDGSIWFTIDHADAIGRVRNGHVERLPTSSRNVEPLGLAVAADGSAWYTDLTARAIARISSAGEIARFVLDTPIARLGRLAIAPDGAAWFADPTGYGMTKLKDGVFSRYQIESARGGPYGVAVTADGAIWATLQNGNQLLRVAIDGTGTTFDLPRGGAVPTDIAAGSDGSVWFLQFRLNRIGRFKDGKFSDVEAGQENAGLSGIAVAPNEDVWFGMMRRASLGRLRNGHIAVFALPRDNARPFSVTVDRDGNVWYADISGFVGMLPAKYAGAG
jgi:virginiamycin B lyase